jgi:hypothetical protein
MLYKRSRPDLSFQGKLSHQVHQDQTTEATHFEPSLLIARTFSDGNCSPCRLVCNACPFSGRSGARNWKSSFIILNELRYCVSVASNNRHKSYLKLIIVSVILTFSLLRLSRQCLSLRTLPCLLSAQAPQVSQLLLLSPTTAATTLLSWMP